MKPSYSIENEVLEEVLTYIKNNPDHSSLAYVIGILGYTSEQKKKYGLREYPQPEYTTTELEEIRSLASVEVKERTLSYLKKLLKDGQIKVRLIHIDTKEMTDFNTSDDAERMVGTLRKMWSECPQEDLTSFELSQYITLFGNPWPIYKNH